jgi:hypothetical protein
MAVLPRQYRRDFTSVYINIKEFIESAQNAHMIWVERPVQLAVIRFAGSRFSRFGPFKKE